MAAVHRAVAVAATGGGDGVQTAAQAVSGWCVGDGAVLVAVVAVVSVEVAAATRMAGWCDMRRRRVSLQGLALLLTLVAGAADMHHWHGRLRW